jgi:hypothetical protein
MIELYVLAFKLNDCHFFIAVQPGVEFPQCAVKLLE